MKPIITIGREYGSGGREIGIRLAEELQIPFYDKELITLVAESGGLDPAFVAKNEEGSHAVEKKGLGRISFASFNYQPSFSDSIFLHQCSAIRKLAAEGPCVIVGRCADFVLREQGSINVFIAAGMAGKIARKRAVAPENEAFTDAQMEKTITRINNARQNYYEHYTGQKWGSSASYHLCVHSDLVGVEGAVKTILAYLNAIPEK